MRATTSSKAVWEQQYAEAQARWEAHKQQVEDANKAELEAGEASTYSSDEAAAPVKEDDADTGGSLASDEALQALREKLTGGE